MSCCLPTKTDASEEWGSVVLTVLIRSRMLKNHGVDDDAMMLMNLSVVVDLFFFFVE
jgi:hypothetical protein